MRKDVGVHSLKIDDTIIKRKIAIFILFMRRRIKINIIISLKYGMLTKLMKK